MTVALKRTQTPSQIAVAPLSSIGEALRILCGLSTEQLAAAVAAQDKASGELLGAAFIRLGFASPADVELAMSYQERLRGPNPRPAAFEMMEVALARLTATREAIEFRVPVTTVPG